MAAITPVTRVFISYSRKDAEFVARLKEALQAKGYDAFVDTEDISGGEQWKKRLDELILNADAVAFVVSPDSVASTVCDWETKRALELGKRLIPLLWRPLAGVEAPAQLAERNYIFFDNPERSDLALNQLCNACDVDIGWVREHTRLVDIATRWDADGRRRDGLLRGRDFVTAKVWAAGRAPRAPEIPGTLLAFIEASGLEEKRAKRVRVRVQAALVMLGLIAIGTGAVWANWTTINPIVSAYAKYRPHVHPSASLMTGRTGPTSSFQDCTRGSTDCPAMIVLPAGTFMMGSADDDPADQSDERPLHRVSIRRFAVSKFEITFAQWQACAHSGGCRGQPNPGDSGWGQGNRPVVNVSWNDAIEYVRWLSLMTGEHYRLLSEAEWEYAARASRSADAPRTRFSWGDEDPVCDTQAQNGAAFHCAAQRNYPVGSFHPNAFGLYDMHGNVWEWVEDCYQEQYDPSKNDGVAIEQSNCPGRVLRGGSWKDEGPLYLRSAYRDLNLQSDRLNLNGFRVARTL